MIPANPYPWPYDGRLVPENTALVVVGAQHFTAGLDPDGRVMGVCHALATAARNAGWQRIWLRFEALPATPRRLGLPPAGSISAGWNNTRRDDAVMIVDAFTTDGFLGTNLDARLRGLGIHNLALCGFGTESLIHSTMRSANDRGYECLLITDACAPVDPALQFAAGHMVTMSGGIFGAIAESATVLAALRHPSISKENP